MASQVQLSNRQRRIKLDTKWFAAATLQLFQAVLDNVKQKPVAFINEQQLDDLSESGILSVVVVNNKAIQKLNNEWMGKDYPTDVLSFPLNLDFADDGLPFEIGELIISAEKATEQAEEFGHSFEREMAFLFVHGCLHIIGFDHMNPKDEKDMFARQKKILNACGFKR